MKRPLREVVRRAASATLLVGALACSLVLAASPPQAGTPLTLRLMTYNLRFASDKPPNAWPDRRPIMREVIAKAAPDVFGTQEGVYGQLKDMASDLPGYAWIGLGRDGGSRGEFMAIFYKQDRFEPLAFDHFWLSDTPTVIGSATWGNSYPRMVTWVRFRDRATAREFLFWNTHFDHQVEEARQKAAALIVERLAKTDPKLPLILVGDFNCPAANSKAYEILTAGGLLADSWPLAARRVNERYNTFNSFKPPALDGVRIDWILARTPVKVERTEIVIDEKNGQFPSDHFPVVAWLTF